MSKLKALRQLKKGDRVRVSGTISELEKLDIPASFAKKAAGEFCVVCRPVSKSSRDVALSLNDPDAERHDYWFFSADVLELPEDPPEVLPAVYVTERLTAAQDLLHQCISIDQQMKNMNLCTHGMLPVIEMLRAVMGAEIDKQLTEGNTPHGS